MTVTRPARTREEIVEEYRAEMLSGVVFHRHMVSHNSVYGYKPCLNRDAYVHAMGALVQLASKGDPFAQVANTCMHRVNLYGTRSEEAAHIYEAAAKCIREGYDDVIRRSGPDAGRPSESHRPFTLPEVIVIALWLSEATRKMDSSVTQVGWCLRALMDEQDYLSAWMLPEFARTVAS